MGECGLWEKKMAVRGLHCQDENFSL